jgi:hypothetical protein
VTERRLRVCRGLACLWVLLVPGIAHAQPDSGGGAAGPSCRVTVSGTVIHLNDSCVTSASIVVPAGMTFDGHGHTIWAADPEDGRFRGAVLVAGGGFVSIVNTVVMGAALGAGCHAGAERLRGIYFDGASGAIRNNTVDLIYRDGSACDEGIGIEVRHAAEDAVPLAVEIAGNLVTRYQKSGIVVHGSVDAHIYGNEIRASGAQDRLSANALQVGPRAYARVTANTITANTAPGDGAAGTGVVLIEARAGTVLSGNLILGGDVGIYVLSSGAIVEENQLIDAGPDGAYDVGIVNLGEGNVVSRNDVRGYRTPYYGIEHASPGSGGRQIE